MGGCRCSYKNCTNTTKTRDNLHFFHYPVKQKDRCRQWIENACKPQFYDLDEDQLRNKVICETHFEDCYFPNIQKKRLLQGAIPTLDGDCEIKPANNERSMKIQDVQVLPANADGTIFVLETNMQNNFQSEKVESYIYTNNGLMLPITKCNDAVDDSMQTMYSESEIEEIDEPQLGLKSEQDIFTNLNSDSVDKEFENYNMFDSKKNSPENVPMNTYEKNKAMQRNTSRLEEQKNQITLNMTNDIVSKALGNKYVKKIEQHSRDIAILKRLLKSKRGCRRPNNLAILNVLRKQIPSSLCSLVNLSLSDNYELASEDLEFFSTIYFTSPQVYEILSQKYQWKLPNPELFSNKKNNGRVCCEDG